MPYELMIQGPDGPPRRLALAAERYSLGRARTNDLCYAEDASLSRKHLQLDRDSQGWAVEDLRSKNGTLLNGARLTSRTWLQPHDRLTAGQLTITFVDTDAPAVRSAVTFVPGAGPALLPSATVMTSLEGLLSGELTNPLTRSPAAMSDPRVFSHPVVRVLIRAGRELAHRRPLDELFQVVLDLSIEAVGADRGVLMILKDQTLVPKAVYGDDLRISTTVRDKVVLERASLLVQDIRQEEALRNQHSIFQQQICTLMAVPLQTEDRVIGLVYVDSRCIGRSFTPDDLNLLTVLANVGAVGIEHAHMLQLQQQERLHRRELEQAAEIQRSILPKQAPLVTGLDLAGYAAPCRTVGGDYYDFIRYPDGRLAVVLGDVAGKGMSAALLMSSLQARVQLLAEEPAALAGMMSRLDRAVAANCPANRFITLFMLVVEPATGEIIYCNAGHNPALVVRASGTVERLAAIGTPLGILPDLGYDERTERLAPGDLIALYSDGLTEAVDAAEEEFGLDRLADVIAAHRHEPAQAILDAVRRELDIFTEAAPPEDDMTLVVVRRVEALPPA